MLNVLGVTVV